VEISAADQILRSPAATVEGKAAAEYPTERTLGA
jgi:hypothetical protein